MRNPFKALNRKESTWDAKFCTLDVPYGCVTDSYFVEKEANEIAYDKDLKIEFTDNIDLKILTVTVL
jgi:hypothetical protein